MRFVFICLSLLIASATFAGERYRCGKVVDIQIKEIAWNTWFGFGDRVVRGHYAEVRLERDPRVHVMLLGDDGRSTFLELAYEARANDQRLCWSKKGYFVKD